MKFSKLFLSLGLISSSMVLLSSFGLNAMDAWDGEPIIKAIPTYCASSAMDHWKDEDVVKNRSSSIASRAMESAAAATAKSPDCAQKSAELARGQTASSSSSISATTPVQQATVQASSSSSSSGLLAADTDERKEQRSYGSQQTTICGHRLTNHALERMAERDCSVAAVTSAINGRITVSKYEDGSLVCDSKKKSVRAIIDPKTKAVITVMPLSQRQANDLKNELKKQKKLFRQKAKAAKNLMIQKNARLNHQFTEEDGEEIIYQSYFDEDYLNKF